MSKKLSKVLVVAVVLVLAMSVFGLVACGGPEPLEGKTAMSTLQKGFDKANGKVTENVKLGNLSLSVAGLLTLGVQNVDVKLVRTYDAEGGMNIDATISNLQASLDSLGVTLVNKLVSVPKDYRDKAKEEMWQDGKFIGETVGLNLNAKMIENFSKVALHANVDIDGGDTCTVTVKAFEITGLDQVVNEKGEQLNALRDGDNEKLGAIFAPSELKGQVVDPNHKSNGTDKDGLFTAMNFYAPGSGTLLKTFINDNYKMISLYNFDSVTVSDGKLSSKAPADLSKVYNLGNEILTKYDKHEIKKDNPKSQVGALVNKVFGTKDVKLIVETLTDLKTSELAMNATVKADGNDWKLDTLAASQKITITLPTAILTKVVGEGGLLEQFGVTLPSSIADMIPNILKKDISTSVDASVNATFEY